VDVRGGGGEHRGGLGTGEMGLFGFRFSASDFLTGDD
jgi:hypothetical protein